MYTDRVLRRVRRWPSVRVAAGRDGETSLVVAGVEFATLSAGGLLELQFDPDLRDQLVTEGLADRPPEPTHHGVAYRVRTPADVAGAIRLLRLSYLCRRLERVAGPRADAAHLVADLRRLGLPPTVERLAERRAAAARHRRE